MRDLLIRAFFALEGELHMPRENSGCECCDLMWEIEQAVGQQLTVNRDVDIAELQSVGSNALH